MQERGRKRKSEVESGRIALGTKKRNDDNNNNFFSNNTPFTGQNITKKYNLIART